MAAIAKSSKFEITVEFRDPFNQVILRDKQRLFLSHGDALSPAQAKNVQIPVRAHPRSGTWYSRRSP